MPEGSQILSRPKILIVEDYHPQQFVFEQLCERFGYDAYIVGTGEAALGALGIAQYAAVIMDINLPGMDGIETVRKFRMTEKGTGRHTPVVALTASGIAGLREECLHAGMDDFMSKPFSVEAFRKILLRWTYDSRRPNMSLITSSEGDDQLLFG
ncbi:MAG: response regulator [Candidatus Melainabacteria bacterium]|nr:MAG: response regulator [Candidatus Melainabacteria bacterium]